MGLHNLQKGRFNVRISRCVSRFGGSRLVVVADSSEIFSSLSHIMQAELEHARLTHCTQVCVDDILIHPKTMA